MTGEDRGRPASPSGTRCLRVALAWLLAAAVLIPPLAGEAQKATNAPRIGFLSASSLAHPRTARFLEAFRQGLRERGPAAGPRVALEARFADGHYDRLPHLAAELVRLDVDVIVTYAAPAIEAAQRATSTIPIVMAAVAFDPVAAGYVASLGRPGGNITGLSVMASELVGKQLELLREIVPAAGTVAVLGNGANPNNAEQLRRARDAARALGVRLQPLEARSPGEIDEAFAAMAAARAGALVVLLDSVLLDHGARIADLAARRRLPTVAALAETVEAGGLMAYGPGVVDSFRRAATYVARILEGARPADLPVEQPTSFRLVINLQTAKTLGLEIPGSVLARADRLIE